MRELHSSTPAGEAAQPGPRKIVGDRDPTNFELIARSINSNVAKVNRLARVSADIGARILAAGRDQLPVLARGDFTALTGSVARLVPTAAPVTRFSRPVSRNRVMEAFGMPLSRIKLVRNHVPDVTLNDVFVAVAGGAVRKYLERHGELPEASLSALMPISLRTDASAGGNEVAGVPVRVRTDIADPIERLLAVHEETRNSKAKAEKLGLDLLNKLLEVLPPLAVNNLLERVILPGINMTVSNVRGPDQAMYLAGAKAMCLYPVSIPSDGVGLNFTGVSYNGVMWVSMVSCRNMVPDPGVFLACMREAWEELLAAATKGQPARGRRARPRRAKA